MIDRFAELCCEMIYFALLASWRALPVFAVVAIVTLVIRNRVPARYLCWLWLIVIARLLLPVSAASVMAISSVADAPAQSLFSSHEEIEPDSDGFDIFTYEDEEGKPVSVAILPDDATPEERAKADAYVSKITAEEKASLALSAARTHVNEAATGEYVLETIEPLLVALSYLLVFGLPAVAFALLTRGIASHLRFAWRLWFIPAICDRATVDCLLRVCDDLLRVLPGDRGTA